ncbi:DNA polymerase III subunit delta' [Pseudidiomarina insulisalsae]|uniref:DNA polymerase III subunit delta' n=1 Tax=Pseudidiomarina insulisalsae TaxID=575789 RepID=UPI0013001B0B|nr:DNA polymerase III subunit delta' [Pseudidiomarina insulisalsae]
MSLPWLRTLWQNLVREQQQGTLAHAHCIPWQPDLGTAALVDEWIKLLLCTQSQKRACGQCKSCLLHQAGNHPDFYRLGSVDGKVISVDQVRELLAKLQQTPNQAGAKVVWLQDAEKLSVTAANALLKTLEEPTRATYFIVTPERTERLLPTLRSRMQLQRIPQPGAEEVAQWLAQRLQRVLTAEEQNYCQRYADRPLALLQWAESGDYPSDDLAELNESFTAGAALPALTKTNWQGWLLATEQWLQMLIRLQQNVAVTQLQLPQQRESVENWLRQHNYQVTELSSWLQLCYAIRQRTNEQSGLNGPLLLKELWMRWL